MTPENRAYETCNVAVLGASGYTGSEIVRLLSSHPYANIVSLYANTHANQYLHSLYPNLCRVNLPILQSLDNLNLSNVDVLFSALPHKVSYSIIEKIFQDFPHIKVIDLSADYRMNNPDLYLQWYDFYHDGHMLDKAVYGLSEIFRPQIKASSLVANPGCYTTSVLLPLYPLAKLSILDEYIIVDAKSAVSGAGRSLNDNLLFSQRHNNISPYSVPKHRHLPEIQHILQHANQTNSYQISFTPHLIPISRGILSTIYIQTTLKPHSIHETLSSFYAQEEFVHVLPFTQIPNTSQVNASNYCLLGVCDSTIPNWTIIVSTIDNLGKGAAGQALQNFNIVADFPENTALMSLPVFP